MKGMKRLLTLFVICFLSQASPAGEYDNQTTEYGDRVSDYEELVDEYREPIWIDPPPILPPPVLITIDKSDFEMTTYSEGEIVSQHKVIIGRPDYPTPTMRTEFSHIIINPVWEVPEVLLYKLVAIIKAQRNPIGYLERRKFRIHVDGKEVDPSIINWRSLPKTGPYSFSVTQDPSPSNFVGQVLFVLEDTNEIQMHDTPDKALFLQDVRTFSSGCIRVEKSVELAEFILRQDVQDLIDLGETVIFRLPRPVAVQVVD
jgi:murein L,D-transpeptidase YcbB/YkuD